MAALCAGLAEPRLDTPFAYVREMHGGKAVSLHTYIDAAAWTAAWGGSVPVCSSLGPFVSVPPTFWR